MKIAFSTLGCPELDFDEVLALAAKYSYDSIELRGIKDELDADKMSVLRPENRAATMEKLKKAGVSVCAIDCSASFHNEGELPRSLEECAYAVGAADEMGVPFLRVFGNSIPAGQDEKTVLDRVARGIKAACREAHGTHVRVLLEVHGDFVTNERLLGLVERVDDPSFGLLWDAEHTANDDFDGMYRAIAPYIAHVHLKDRTGEGRLCLPGEGILPLGHIVSLLRDGGYDGALSLEWEKRWHPELADIDTACRVYMELIKKSV